MSDRELLELAAKASGMEINQARQAERDAMIDPQTAGLWIKGGCTFWNPLTDDGQALRLAVKMKITPNLYSMCVSAQRHLGDRYGCTLDLGDDPCAATRRAIVLTAAEIGEDMP